MKELPILFSSEMVKAILEGRKTQTRRIIKPQPPNDKYQLITLIDTTDSEERKHRGKNQWAIIDGLNIVADQKIYFKSRYQVGDRLWVRETFCYGNVSGAENGEGNPDILFISQCKGESDIIFKEEALRENIDIEEVVWRPSIHMPKWAARIWLEVTGVKVERVQDISIKDAFAEGVSTQQASHAQPFFQSLWDSLNAKRGYSWKSNPWVWVIEFKRSK